MAPGKDYDSHSRHRRDGDRNRDDNDEPRHREDRKTQRQRPSDRDRDRDRDHERRRSRDRRRSRTPESSARRRRSRDGERDRGRDRSGDRDRRRRRSRGERDSHHRRHRSDDESSEHGNSRALARRRQSPMKRSGPLPSQADSFATTQTGGEPEKPKEKPNLGNTGLLATMANTVTQVDGSSTVLKYHEPPEARKPSPRDQWKLFVFKGGDIVDTIDLSSRTCWLVGREMAIVDLSAEHPSISKQHAVIQFRYTEKTTEFGDKIGKVKPFLIDLESANGTILNDKKISDKEYLQLRDKDMIKFGHSTREYVIMLAPRD